MWMAIRDMDIAAEMPTKKDDTAKAVSFARIGFTPMISAAMSISLMAIYFRPCAPRVMLRAITAQMMVKNRQKR